VRPTAESVADLFGISLMEAETYIERGRWVSLPEDKPEETVSVKIPVPLPGPLACRALLAELIEDDRIGTGQNGTSIIRGWFANYLKGVGR
jgi:hypothetical protein